MKENPVSGRVLIRVSIRFRPAIPSRKITLFLRPWASCENTALGEDALKLNTHPGSCSSGDDGLHASPRQHQQNLGLFSNAAKSVPSQILGSRSEFRVLQPTVGWTHVEPHLVINRASKTRVHQNHPNHVCTRYSERLDPDP